MFSYEEEDSKYSVYYWRELGLSKHIVDTNKM